MQSPDDRTRAGTKNGSPEKQAQTPAVRTAVMAVRLRAPALVGWCACQNDQVTRVTTRYPLARSSAISRTAVLRCSGEV